MNNLTWKYVKPLKNDNAVECFEADNGFKLPPDIISYIKQNNGGRPDKKIFDTEVSKGRLLKSLLSFNKDDLETVYDAIDILKNENTKLVPIATDPGGNYICYHTIHHDIVLWLHETNTTERISDSFTAFLETLR
ncbi:SMI1/KNR4 family protein [Clostridium sporogenes]|uniref:SMI1/KNR4 family protein n=1 Tax=Clostridium TaxID=1485 RepID=UPI00169211BD|nr:SMI1/KNR4 family protein [Clostridium tyrobutyricum]MBV4450361.1 SMI1/KNR4 family protein [Clostridium tyrobutyricum]NLK71505.1 SMI1/KNR4 family protein [Clostridiales bacterium]